MTYITENPWPLIAAALGIAVIAFVTAVRHSGLIALICVALSVGLVLLEAWLVSPREAVQSQIDTMLENFRQADVDGVSSQISEHSPHLIEIAQKGLDLVTLDPAFHLRSSEVELEDDLTAVAYVRANGTVTVKKLGGQSRHIATYWRLTWSLESGQWKLSDVERLHVTTGEVIDYFDAS